MKTYTFIGGWFDKTYGVFTEPVAWNEGNGEIEVFISLNETGTSSNYQFVLAAYHFTGNDNQPLLLVSAGSDAPVRATVKAVTLKLGEKVKIKIQPYLTQP